MTFDQMVEGRETAAPAKRGLELRRKPVVIVGGLPSVSLIPVELRSAARDKRLRRWLIGGVVAALVVAGGGTAGATVLTTAAQAQLDAATTRSQNLNGQLGKFKDVQILQQSIALGDAAVSVGESTEIDWQAQLDSIEANMPSGYDVTTVTADSASVIAGYPQGTSPLEQPRAASLQMTVTTKTISELPIWLRKIRSIPAYADATASVSSNDDTGYTVALTIHLSSKALVNAKKAN